MNQFWCPLTLGLTEQILINEKFPTRGKFKYSSDKYKHTLNDLQYDLTQILKISQKYQMSYHIYYNI